MKGQKEELHAGRFIAEFSSCESNFKAKLAETKVLPLMKLPPLLLSSFCPHYGLALWEL